MGGSAYAIQRAQGGDSLIAKRTLSGNRLRLNTVTGTEVADLKWHNLNLINSFQNFNRTKRPPGWAIDAQGIVHLRGYIVNGNDNPSDFEFAVLPPAARPTALHISMATVLDGGALVIGHNGSMSTFGTDLREDALAEQTSLDGVTYSLH